MDLICDGGNTVCPVPRVDAADHVLRQEVGGRVARPRRFRHQQYDQPPGLEVAPAVVDVAPEKKQRPYRLKCRHGERLHPAA